MINARPQLNGNTRDDFVEAYKAIAEARTAISNARRKLFGDVLNGRNYQHHSDGAAACQADRDRYFAELVKVDEALEAISGDIIEAVHD